MHGSSDISADEFFSVVRPLLERRDLTGLVHEVQARWTTRQVRSLLHCKCLDTRKVALLTLAWIGSRCCLEDLAKSLRDPDPMIGGMAEHALWTIWFRLGDEPANHELCRGSQALDRKDYPSAIKHFTKAAEIDPTFAEAYNQRAIVHFLLGDYARSAKDCQVTTKLMPIHFGAWAGLGHCHVHNGQQKLAISAYRKALEINPHMECIAESIEELESGGGLSSCG